MEKVNNKNSEFFIDKHGRKIKNNLKPIEKGQKLSEETRQRIGDGIREAWKKKRAKQQFSDIVREVASNPELYDKAVKKKPEWADAISEMGITDPMAIMAAAQIIRAMTGDTRAFDAVRKAGWGEDINISGDMNIFNGGKVEIEIVKSKHKEE